MVLGIRDASHQQKRNDVFLCTRGQNRLCGCGWEQLASNLIITEIKLTNVIVL